MSLARIKHQLSGLTAILECTVELHGLTDRYALVVATVQNQQRRGDLVAIADARAFEILADVRVHDGAVILRIAEERVDVAGNIRGAGHRQQRWQAGAHHGGLEAPGLRHHPRCHIATVAPPFECHAGGIGDAALDEVIHAGHDVAIITAAPVAGVGVHPPLTVAGGAAWVRIEHRPAACGIRLPRARAGLEAVCVRSGWPAVCRHQERHAGPLAISHRQQQHALHLAAILRLPREYARRPKCALAEPRIGGGDARGRGTAVLHIHFPRQLGGVEHHRQSGPIAIGRESLHQHLVGALAVALGGNLVRVQ